MKTLPITVLALAALAPLFLPACKEGDAQAQAEAHEQRQKIVVTSPVAQDVISTQQYVCQIHSRRHIEVRALETAYLGEVHVQEGQAVKQGDVLFRSLPILYQASLDSEMAEAQLAQIKYENTKLLFDKSIVSEQELALAKAELSRTQAKVKRAQAELNFTALRAPFDGIVDRQLQQQGSLVEEGDILSTLSDNQVMWVYFNVPEARYFEYKARLDDEKAGLDLDLRLANGKLFDQPGKIGAIEADFDNETGNIPFRADFANPDGLLRHGQTGTILIHEKLPGAIVIPQRATYEILDKKYVFVIEPGTKQDSEHHKPDAKAGHESAEKEGAKHSEVHAKQHGVVRQREIVIQEEMDDIYVIEKGLNVNDKIIFEGVRQVRDGDEVEYDFRPAKDILGNQKFHAE